MKWTQIVGSVRPQIIQNNCISKSKYPSVDHTIYESIIGHLAFICVRKSLFDLSQSANCGTTNASPQLVQPCQSISARSATAPIANALDQTLAEPSLAHLPSHEPSLQLHDRWMGMGRCKKSFAGRGGETNRGPCKTITLDRYTASSQSIFYELFVPDWNW